MFIIIIRYIYLYVYIFIHTGCMQVVFFPFVSNSIITCSIYANSNIIYHLAVFLFRYKCTVAFLSDSFFPLIVCPEGFLLLLLLSSSSSPPSFSSSSSSIIIGSGGGGVLCSKVGFRCGGPVSAVAASAG